MSGNAVWRLQHGEIVVDQVLSSSVKLARDLKELRAQGKFSFYCLLEEPESTWDVVSEKPLGLDSDFSFKSGSTSAHLLEKI